MEPQGKNLGIKETDYVQEPLVMRILNPIIYLGILIVFAKISFDIIGDSGTSSRFLLDMPLTHILMLLGLGALFVVIFMVIGRGMKWISMRIQKKSNNVK